MAKRKSLPTDGRTSNSQRAYWVDETTNFPERAVHDADANQTLTNIAGALGVGDTTPSIYNLNIINAGQEYSQVLPANTKTFVIKSRNRGALRLAYASGGTSTAYLTIPLGSSFIDEQFYGNITVYVQSTKPGDVIEIVAYT